MAIDNNSLCYLFDSIFQVENIAGKPVVGGHIEVFVAGTDQKYITWQNFDGTKNPFKIPLNNDGRAVVLVEPHYTYDIYIYDSFNNMICSRLNVKPAIGGDVTVYGLTQVWHDESMSGEGTPQSPLSVVSAGKVYDGIEPIVVNNIENKISANHVPLGVQDPLYFVQDDEEGCIIGCSAQTEIPAELSGKWDNAADAVIANSAQWAEGTEYEAGSYVDIDNNTISVTGLQPEGDYAYNSALSSKLDVTALPQDLVHSGDLTAYQTAGNYLSATDSGNFYPMTGNPSGFLTAHQSLEGYATEQWVEDKGYITGIDIQESANWNEATTVVNNNSAIWNNTTNVVSSNSAQWGASNPQIPVTGINGIKISESGDKVVFEVSADYALADDLTGKQNSLTFGYKDTAISSIDNSALYDNSAHARITTLAGRISDLSSNKLDTTAFSDVSGDFYTTANESGFVTTTDLQNVSGEITALIPTALTGEYVSGNNESGFAITSPAGNIIVGENDYFGSQAIGIIKSNSGIWLSPNQIEIYGNGTDETINANDISTLKQLSSEKADITALTAYQEITGMTAYQEAGDYYSASNPSGFITGVDLTPYQLTADMTGYLTTGDSANFLTAVPAGTMNESAFGYDANDKISGYNGSAFAGGSDVPEGVIVESGLEYNAVNEISGYNGSAIAQYGAEKQWLVHDDTLVHASNSAQYALGVNLSAVQQLMGIDETLLWSGTITATGQPVNLNETISNFSKLKFVLSMDSTQYEYIDNNADRSLYTVSWQNMSNNDVYLSWMRISANNDKTKIAIDKSKALAWPSDTTAVNASNGHVNWEWTLRALTKVIGIGRKQ